MPKPFSKKKQSAGRIRGVHTFPKGILPEKWNVIARLEYETRLPTIPQSIALNHLHHEKHLSTSFRPWVITREKKLLWKKMKTFFFNKGF